MRVNELLEVKLQQMLKQVESRLELRLSDSLGDQDLLDRIGKERGLNLRT